MPFHPLKWNDLSDCRKQPMVAFTFGAVAAVTGLDMSLPYNRGLHWAIAGAGADVYCRGEFILDQQTAMCSAAGIAGGLLVTLLRNRGLAPRPLIPYGTAVTPIVSSIVPMGTRIS